jgi:hypothetical protein
MIFKFFIKYTAPLPGAISGYPMAAIGRAPFFDKILFFRDGSIWGRILCVKRIMITKYGNHPHPMPGLNYPRPADGLPTNSSILMNS